VRDENEVLLSAYHEAAHAVFAHYDDIDVYNVCIRREWKLRYSCRPI
jgi:hypothetical protein